MVGKKGGEINMTQKIQLCLWFDKECEEAINFYIDTFNNRPGTKGKESRIVSINRYPDDMQVGPMKDMQGKVLTAFFELEGQTFQALDGGPLFKFNEALSLSVDCEDQEEVDYFWNKLTANGGEESQCGWLKDKFGLSWQIIPKRLGELLEDPDREKAGRALQAMLQMQKLDVQKLEDAFNGK